MTSALGKLGIAVLTNAAIAILVLFIWMICLRRRFPTVYKARRYQSKLKHKPPEIGEGLFDWIKPTWDYDIHDIGRYIGPDQYVYLRVQHFSFILFGALSIFNIFGVLPVNLVGNNDNETDGEKDVTGLDLLSMSNIKEESNLLYVHMFSVYVSFSIFATFMVALWNDMLDIRIKWLSENILPSVFNVILLDIPENLDKEDVLLEKFRELFPGQVEHAILTRDFSEENKVLLERNNAFDKLKSTHLNYECKKKKKPELERPLFRKGGAICCGGEKVDAITHWKDVLDEKNKALKEIQAKDINDYKSVRAGFLTFNSSGASTLAVQSLCFRDGVPIIIPGVEPELIVWPNMKLKAPERKVRRLFGRLLWAAILAVFAIPAAFIQSLANLEELAQQYSWMEWANDIPPPINGWLESLLPPVLTIVLFILMPIVACLLCKLQGQCTIPKIHRGGFSKMFYFSVCFIFLFQLIGGSVLSKASYWADDPAEIPTDLGIAIPENASFFINFILLMGFVGPAIQLMAIGPLIKHLILKRLKDMMGIHVDEKADPPMPMFSHVKKPPKIIVAILLVISYSTIAPVVLPIGMISMGIQYVANKHQLMYLFDQQYQSGGLFWPKYSGQLMGSFLVYNVTMIVLFGIKKSPIAAGLTVIPLVGLYVLSNYLQTYEKAYMNLSLQAAKKIDKETAAYSSEKMAWLTDIFKFRNPAYIAEQLEYDFDISRQLSENPLHGQSKASNAFDEADGDIEAFKEEPEYSEPQKTKEGNFDEVDYDNPEKMKE
eukprot:Nk52_evm8s351 gene=Nk52_evmTU8s351